MLGPQRIRPFAADPGRVVVTVARLIRLFLGLVIVSAGVTLLFLGMRAVMMVGGFCAEGGPYQIAVHCPKGTAALMPLSIFSLFIGGGLYLSGQVTGGPNYLVLVWTGLFTALGWNFLEFGLYPPGGEGVAVGWLVCAFFFALMSGIWILPFKPKALWGIFIGDGSRVKKVDPRMAAVRQRMAARRGRGGGPFRVASAPPDQGDGVAAQLAHLAGLHEKGHLTDDEFRRAKDAVLRGGGAA